MLKSLIQHKYKNSHPEKQYLDLIHDIIERGTKVDAKWDTLCLIEHLCYFQLKTKLYQY